MRRDIVTKNPPAENNRCSPEAALDQIWEITMAVWSLKNREAGDAQFRLQRDVVHIERRRG